MSSTAHAEWSPEAKAEMLAQLNGIMSAETAIGYSMGHAANVPAEAAQVDRFLRSMISGWREHFRGVLWIFDVNGDGSSSWAYLLETETRDQIIERGFAEIESARVHYSRAQEVLDGLTTTTNTYEVMKRHIGRALASTTINKQLDYTEPRLDENLTTFPGARGESANFGPHGWYRWAGTIVGGWAWHHERKYHSYADLLALDPSLGTWLNGRANHARIVGAAMVYGVGLLAGVESETYRRHLDTMEAGGTTTRSRHFFRGLLISESLLAFTHKRKPAAIDVNGRNMRRGAAYDLDTNCKEFAAHIARMPDLPAKAYTLLDMIVADCEEWARTDDFVQSAVMTLKWHQVFPPNAPRVDCPECPELPEEITCGPGTFLLDAQCLPSPTECNFTPAFTAGGTVHCVEAIQ